MVRTVDPNDWRRKRSERIQRRGKWVKFIDRAQEGECFVWEERSVVAAGRIANSLRKARIARGSTDVDIVQRKDTVLLGPKGLEIE